MNRFHQAIGHGPGTPLHEIAQSVLLAQREVTKEGGGSLEVRNDPAVRAMVQSMGARLNVQALEDEILAYSEMNETVRERLAQVQSTPEQGADADPAPRRWQDAEYATSAVNVGALAGTVGRHALALDGAGQDTDNDPALRQIVHQMASLCATLNTAPKDVQAWTHACRTAVAAQTARDTLIDLNGHDIGTSASASSPARLG